MVGRLELLVKYVLLVSRRLTLTVGSYHAADLYPHVVEAVQLLALFSN